MRPSSRICRNWAKPRPALAEQVGLGHAGVGEGEPVGVGRVPAHLPVGRLHLEARRARRHDDRADLARAGAGGDRDERGDLGARVGDERLLAVDHPLARRRRRASAVVRVPPASLPASGSVRPKPPRVRPAQRSGSHVCFCSSVPKRWIGLAPRPTPASRVMAIEWSTRASSSMAMHSIVRSPPPPPYSSGNGMPNSPRSPMPRTTSTGKWWSRSHASACGAISPSAKSRTTLRSASCSSVNSTCTVATAFQADGTGDGGDEA